ncbi:heme exporter protein CcmB [Aurantibacillus circumpalustris]|uniref:heme exporter protein CcmB n=1 Tax=Aurantibacillus circumpalustris TaxID=3036359 RepID=UPI00295BB66A|nr:heme exporter protein CcmB [Aurantibacillus circumpalustris]
MLGALIKKEFLLEFRQKSTIGGVLVYVIGTIFVSALCFKGKLDKPTWNALFWVITLFTSVTISGKSFLKETGGQALFNFLHYSPQQFIIAKILYNMVFMLCLSFITFFFYAFFIKNEVENMSLFFIVLILASTGLAGVLSLMSAISSKASGNFAIMSILSFPVIMPLILVVIRLSKQAVDGIEWAGVGLDFIVILGALNVLTLALSFLLFPYLWRD